MSMDTVKGAQSTKSAFLSVLFPGESPFLSLFKMPYKEPRQSTYNLIYPWIRKQITGLANFYVNEEIVRFGISAHPKSNACCDSLLPSPASSKLSSAQS